MRTVARGIAIGTFVVGVTAQDAKDKYMEEFDKFISTYEKTYTSEDEKTKRFKIFKSNFVYIETENAKGTNGDNAIPNKYQVGVNGFADQDPEEFASTHYGYKMPAKLWGNLKNLGTHVYDGAPLADSIDWVAKGAVTAVKNQGQCGSCWSFSTTGGLEGAAKIATGKLVSLSEEMLVDCSKKNDACGGGSMDVAFQYVETAGLCTEASYPYTSGGGTVGTCKASSCTKGLQPGAVTGFHDVSHDEKSMMSALTLGPVSIAVEADKSVFQLFKSGVMTGMCGTKLDHGILAVGYGTESGTDYWMVKNSWGTVWGEKGYGKLERGKNAAGECGILTGATYPKVTGKPGPAPAPTPPAPPAPGPAPAPTPPAPAPPSPPAPGIPGIIEKAFCKFASDKDIEDKAVPTICGKICEKGPLKLLEKLCEKALTKDWDKLVAHCPPAKTTIVV